MSNGRKELMIVSNWARRCRNHKRTYLNGFENVSEIFDYVTDERVKELQYK